MKRIWFFIQEKYRLSGVCIVVLWVLLPVGLSGQKHLEFVQHDYRETFGSKYDDAIRFIFNEKWIADSLAKNDIDPKFAMAIVFPELIRFSFLQNYIELQGLFTLYVQYGASYANFSVGRFQMKPTFAEQVEKDSDRYLKVRIYRSNSTTDKSVLRLQRVKRLQSMHWQVQYLISFIRIMDVKFQCSKWKSSEEKLKFYATAYNCGYVQSEKYLHSKIEKVSFYVSVFNSTTRYNYADIAASYFNSLGL